MPGPLDTLSSEHWRGGASRHHATSLPSLPVTPLSSTLQATSLPSSLCRLSNHLNTKRKDAGASWHWQHPVFLIVGDTHPHKSSSGRIETPRLMLSPGCIKLKCLCVRKPSKYLGWVINSFSDSWRVTIYPSESRAAVFPRSEIATPNGADAWPSVWGGEGRNGRERDGFPSFTFRIFNVRREGSDWKEGQMLANPADVCLRLISFMWVLSL